ncbi:hypothetical protein FHL15_006028 [Xylaria flabelliformis]|uniref:Uncharacterized protein n=1 Tax=Xylaria flabelliformis TaxID=2512241 RepID=A0A553HYZ0_9PEZI|nr:hypothetical protein FHL15_006028 [Xylaria flabelliformis]
MHVKVFFGKVTYVNPSTPSQRIQTSSDFSHFVIANSGVNRQPKYYSPRFLAFKPADVNGQVNKEPAALGYNCTQRQRQLNSSRVQLSTGVVEYSAKAYFASMQPKVQNRCAQTLTLQPTDITETDTFANGRST